MTIAQFRNDSAGTIYLDDYGHQQILVAEVVTMTDEAQKTKFGESTQLDTLLSAGDLVYIDDLGADRNYADAEQILKGTRDKVVAGGLDGEYLCTNPTGDLIWGAGAIVIKDEGVAVSADNCTAMNFMGPPITVVDAGSGQVNVTVVALMDIVEDTTPQLGGMLDVNGNAIGDGTLELIKFVETGSAVNEITITNAATSSGPSISATGDDTNIDLVLDTKGTGDIDVSTNKIVNVVDPVAAQDAATKAYVDATGASSFLQKVETNIGAGSTTLTLATDTAPTIATGVEICTLNITPDSTSNQISLSWNFLGDTSSDRAPVVMVFRDSTLLMLDMIVGFKRGWFGACSGTFIDNPATTSEVTYSMRLVISDSGTVYWGQNSTGKDFGGAATIGQKLVAMEIVIG